MISAKKIIAGILILNVWAQSEPSPPSSVTWPMMSELNIETGEASEALQSVNHQFVEVSGFIVPLEMDDMIDEVSDFLLVPDPMACIHVPPPPPNQMISVKMKAPIPLDMDYRGVAIQGQLSIVQADGIYTYELAGESAKDANIEFDDPFLELMGY